MIDEKIEHEYVKIVNHYEQCFLKHGDNHLGVDWPNETDLDKRFKVAYELIRKNCANPISLLDFGCGNGLFINYLQKQQLEKNIQYTGLDLSPLFIETCRKKYPQYPFVCTDIFKNRDELPHYDYIILNGVLTEKCSLPFNDMWHYAKSLLITLFNHCKVGMAFNVMSEHVDWKRDDLFHVPFDLLAEFLQKNLSRHYVFRNDYQLYEYTTYVYR